MAFLVVHSDMYNQQQHAELFDFIQGQCTALGVQLSNPMEPGDTVFVFNPLPSWMGKGLEHRFVVFWPPDQSRQPGQFLLCMDVHFGEYHRRMELVAGSQEELHRFAKDNPPVQAISDAIVQLMRMEKATQERT